LWYSKLQGVLCKAAADGADLLTKQHVAQGGWLGGMTWRRQGDDAVVDHACGLTWSTCPRWTDYKTRKGTRSRPSILDQAVEVACTRESAGGHAGGGCTRRHTAAASPSISIMSYKARFG
jgi:hypothetical protein